MLSIQLSSVFGRQRAILPNHRQNRNGAPSNISKQDPKKRLQYLENGADVPLRRFSPIVDKIVAIVVRKAIIKSWYTACASKSGFPVQRAARSGQGKSMRNSPQPLIFTISPRARYSYCRNIRVAPRPRRFFHCGSDFPGRPRLASFLKGRSCRASTKSSPVAKELRAKKQFTTDTDCISIVFATTNRHGG